MPELDSVGRVVPGFGFAFGNPPLGFGIWALGFGLWDLGFPDSLLDFANILQVRLGASRPADMAFAAAKASAENFSSFLHPA